MDDLEKRIVWLAGLTDGEGTITVFTHKDNSQKWEFRRYTAIYCIVNTDPNIINEVQKILNDMGVSSYVFLRKSLNDKHSDAFQLSTRKMSHVKVLLEKLIPYLIGKKAQAELTLRFVNSRLNRMGTGKNGYSPYNDEEIEISHLLYELNKRGRYKSSETLCQTAIVKEAEDIVRTCGRPQELKS